MTNSLHYITSSKDAHALISTIFDGTMSYEAICAFLGELKTVPISEQMLSGFRSAMLERAVTIDLDGLQTIDICGTGGDGKDTFNVSTLAALLVAACGYNVTKHGNTSFSSACGSSDILQLLGVKLPSTPDQVKRQVERCAVTFLHAPFFHPALKTIGPARKKLGFRTVFNILGPLCNPVSPSVSVLGVASYPVYRAYKAIISTSKNSYAVLWDENGYDEISLTGRAFYSVNRSDHVLVPEELIPIRLKTKDLTGGDSPEQNAKIFRKIAEGEGTSAQSAVVAANAALAISLIESSKSFVDIFNNAQEVLNAGKLIPLITKLNEEI
jgi:anthranilate phosphoribosyltransferase